MDRTCRKYIFISVIMALAGHQYVRGQGCSDAGFCTMPTLNPESGHERRTLRHNSVRFAMSYGKADHGIDVRSGYLQFGRSFANGVGIDMKATFVSLSDGKTSSSGLSDIFASAAVPLTDRITGTAGVKIPLGNGNARENNASLPMDFQPTLGTLDVIVGAAFSLDDIHIAVALQQPLTRNKNGFTAEQFPAASSFRKFQSTNEYSRSGDVLLRLSYPVTASEEWSITPGILPIYHLANDSYVDIAGTERTIAGSQGMTLNLNLCAAYTPGPGHTIDTSIGFPVVTRTARPDGLTRSAVVAVEYKILW